MNPARHLLAKTGHHELLDVQTARQRASKCTDNFAEYMGADYDTNGDGKIDADGLRYVSGESESRAM